MKNTILLLAATLSLLSCAETSSLGTTAPHESQVMRETAAVSTISLHVQGMTCKSCENAIKNAVKSLPGVTAVTASFLEERVTVSFEAGTITLDTIKEAITKLGYVIT